MADAGQLAPPAKVASQALILPVPEVDAALHFFRSECDPLMKAGVPAHVTLMVPFSCEDPATAMAELASICRETEPFEFALTTVGWFGDEFLWLGPDPEEPFAALIERIASAFGLVPYGGRHAEVQPHVTVGVRSLAGGRLGELARDLDGYLPISSKAAEVLLMTERGDADWGVSARFRLGP